MKKEGRKIRESIGPDRAEAYKMLKLIIEALMNKNNLKILAFSSLSDAEDKVRHVFTIAQLMAKDGKRVLLLECNFKDSKVNQLMDNLNNEETNNNNVSLDIIDPDILLNNQMVGDSEFVLNASNINMIPDSVKEKYDVILIDAPPIGYSADGVKLCAAADGTVLIMRAGKTPVELALKSKEILKTVDANVIGMILEK